MEGSPTKCGIGIAIVEDEKALVEIYEKVFSRKNIAISFVAYDGLEAVKKFVKCMPKPHVMLMDYRLPIMDGIEATREILKLDPATKVVFLSADVSVERDAMQAGAFKFLKKPASIKDITNSVELAISRAST